MLERRLEPKNPEMFEHVTYPHVLTPTGPHWPPQLYPPHPTDLQEDTTGTLPGEARLSEFLTDAT